jgi:hypothetical protein
MAELRTYQEEAVEAIYRHLREREDNPCVVLPTGSGKTFVMARICADAVGRWNGRVLILAHVRELLEQALEKIRLVAPEMWTKTGVNSAGLKSRDTEHPIIIAGIQSVYKRACQLDAFDLVIVDEAHMIPPEGDGMYRTFLKDARTVNPNLRAIGLTATPFRMKSGMICEPQNVLNHVCYEIGVKELIVQGYLCPLVTKGSREAIDTSGLHVRAGEFIASEAEDLMDRDNLVQAACSEILEQTHARRSVLIFASGVRHGRHVAEVLSAKSGRPVGTVFGETPDEERDEVLDSFRYGELKYLVNINVLTMGFDAPNIDCVAMVRPTMSPGLYYQMCLDMETEVLTLSGWARCEQVKVGDYVGVFDLENGRIVFSPAQEKVHRPLAPGETMYGVSSPHLDIRVTDRHTMIYRGRSRTCLKWQKREAWDLADYKDSFLVPVAADVNREGLPLTDDELRFLGWFFTDGYRNPANSTVVISQSLSSPYRQDIEDALRGCGFGYRVYRIPRTKRQAKYADILQFVVPYGKPRGDKKGLRGWKDLARYFNGPLIQTLGYISRRQLRVLLEAMNLGDGKKHESKGWKRRTFELCLGEHKFMADQFQALFILHGFRCNISVQKQKTLWNQNEPKPQYILHVREQQVATIGGANSRGNALIPRRSRFGPVPFDRKEHVWCVRTSRGTLVTRRNGKVCIMGNCGRGFRLNGGKENCLVLDFGGNVLRHGPVDAIRVHKANRRGNGDAPAKQCPECQSLVETGYAVCPDCGYEFPPPKRQNHDATASVEDILSGQVTTTVHEVEAVHYRVHHKRGAPDDAPKTMRVEYRVGFHKYQSEWICFEHTGWARQKAESWWRRRSNAPVPDSAAEAVELVNDGALCDTRSITVRSVAGEEYPSIIGYDLGTKPAWREPGLDDDLGEEVHTYAGEGGLPF